MPAKSPLHMAAFAGLERQLSAGAGGKSRYAPAATIPADKELYQRQIEVTDRQIDALVYELYGLSDYEIAIVEAASW